MAGAAAGAGLLNFDKISSLMGAPPHHWKQNEIAQIKHIHRCYKNAHTRKVDGDDVTITHEVDEEPKKETHKSATKELKSAEGEDLDDDEYVPDQETFLPKDSCLRSKAGDKKVPANPAFKDYEAFKNSCSFDFWRSNFEKTPTDKFLSETAESIVANICVAQSTREIKVSNGVVPLRKKREQITPLALVLHELKLWATHSLRTADVYNEETYQDIRCKMRYVNSLAQKEVWGDTVIGFGAGMNVTAFDKLFRLLLSSKNVLERAYEYSLRGFNRRSSREKLQKAGNLLKDLIVSELKMVSHRVTLTKYIGDPKTPRLQPNDLFNSIENMPFVDFSNMANVILWKLCQNPLVAASFDGDYDSSEVKKIIGDLASWSSGNLFCKPSTDVNGEPECRMDSRREYKVLPAAYRPAQEELKRKLREVDPKADVPLPAKSHVSTLKKCFENEANASQVVELMLKNLAAVQNLFPSIYAIHQLWSLAGDGGDFTVYDTMKDQVIRVMTNTTIRVNAMKEAGTRFKNQIGKLASEKEDAMNKAFIANGQAKFKPAWVRNHKFIDEELSTNYNKTYVKANKRLYELAKDARDYTLSTDQLDDKVEDAKKIFDAITGYTPEPVMAPAVVAAPVVESIPDSVPIPVKKAPVAAKAAEESNNQVKKKKDEENEFGKNNMFGEETHDKFDYGDGYKPEYDSDDSSV